MFFSALLAAGTCEIQYDRTACPGKEKISYKKCDGEKTCSKFVETGSANECKVAATKSCANSRFTVTKSKVINALYDGDALTTDSGNADFCAEYENRTTEFNQC